MKNNTISFLIVAVLATISVVANVKVAISNKKHKELQIDHIVLLAEHCSLLERHGEVLIDYRDYRNNREGK